ncbi:MAG: hypothetical protein Q7T70_02510 [Polaromonas sp.]|nr:hypothetical protein [Polaromonas sp.]
MAVNVELGMRRVVALLCGLIGAVGVVAIAEGIYKTDIVSFLGGALIVGAAYGLYRAIMWVMNGFYSPKQPSE